MMALLVQGEGGGPLDALAPVSDEIEVAPVPVAPVQDEKAPAPLSGAACLPSGSSQVCRMAASAMMAPVQDEAGKPLGLMALVPDNVEFGIDLVALVHDDEAPAQWWPALEAFLSFCSMNGKKRGVPETFCGKLVAPATP